MELGRSRAEVELTKKLARELVVPQVMVPMQAMGWRHGTPPTTEQVVEAMKAQASADGQPGTQEGAPAGNAAPAAAAQGGQPDPAKPVTAPAPPAKTDAPPDIEAARNVLVLLESLRDPATGLIMGKYKEVPDALKGAGHLANMAKGALGRAETAEAALLRIQGQPVAAPPAAASAAAPAERKFTPAPRADVDAAQAHVDKVLSKVVENGGVFDGDSAREYAAAVRELATASGRAAAEDDRREVLHNQSVENDKWTAVNEYMKTTYPDSVNFSDEVGLYVRSNPLLAEAVQALVAQKRETRAAELAWTEFDKFRGGPGTPVLTRAEAEVKESDLAAREQVRKEQRDAALKDAGIVHGSAGGSSPVETPGITGPSQDDINSYADGMRREGDAPGSASAARWRHAVIGRFLPPELFGPSQG